MGNDDGDNAALNELPEEVQQLIELKRQKNKERIDALGVIVSKRRDAAAEARKSSGIEQIWKEDEEYYLGIDDANRATNVFTKSMSPDGGLSSNTKQDTEGRCTAFFNITRQFVDSASARMGDILLPASDWNFSIKPSPVPDLEEIKGSTQPVVSPQGNKVFNSEDGKPFTLGQFAAGEITAAAAMVKKAETRIRDWLTECAYHAEVRKVIEDATKIGTGVLRGAYPAKRKTRVVKNGVLKIEENIVPTSKRVDPRNFFTDPNCGDNIQNGEFVLERDFMSARQLRDLIGMPGYIEENIKKVLAEGVDKVNVNVSNGTLSDDNKTKDDDRFRVWYYFGLVDINDLKAMPQTGLDEDCAKNMVPAVVVLINDTVIKGYVNPLDNGEFPYDVMPWQRMSDSPWGIGISRQGRTAQEMLLSAARVLMENAGLSSTAMLVINQDAIVPADGSWNLTRGKVFLSKSGSDMRSASEAIYPILIPSMQVELSNIITMAYKMMEDATGVSFLLQGQQGSAPDTVGGMNLLHQNSSAMLRRIARVFDECITEPHIRRYYDWLLIHGEDDEKGDLKIEAIGSTALVEREIQSQQAVQILNMANDPAYGMSKKKAKDELLRAWRFEPSKFDMDEKEKEEAANQQPPQAPAVQVAQIRVASEEKQLAAKIQHEQETTVAKLDHDIALDKNDSDRDTQYNQSLANRDRLAYESRMAELNLRKELAMMDYASKHNLKLEDIKAKLSDTVMKLTTQKELAASDAHVSPVVTSPVEIPGRAEAGHAYQQ